ncbi:MAG: class I SAM-dependent methyltransferase [Gammaproteobacteria bacterium]|nr:class I SAM-dependent methyltransferase [Gammaproteobacteria bacterium]
MALFSSRRKPPVLTRLYNRLVRGQFARDLLLDLQLEAKRESVAYVKAHMRSASVCDSREALHRLALERVEVDGLYLEFGVKKGGSIRGIAARTRAIVHGFDSFEGLPEDWAGTSLRKGKFSTGGRLPKVPANVTLHPGWFDDSLPRFAAEHAGPVAFMHVDCDLYSSTRTVFANLGARLVPGTVIVFDEYFNYPNWQEHEFRAFQEFVAAQAVRYDYLGFVARAGCVAVRITGRGA